MTDRPWRVLIACSYSGYERDAYRALGHDAYSCDILPADEPSPYHIQGDVRDLLNEEWDLVSAHPPCTYLANSGVRWLYTEEKRWQHLLEGADFFRLMFQFNTPRLCVENPVQHRWAKLAHGMGEPTQTVQPYHFGHLETKRTAYWLRGLPPLRGTHDVEAEMRALPKSETHKVHLAPPGPDRWKFRSTAFKGIADAMAAQWAGPAANLKEAL